MQGRVAAKELEERRLLELNWSYVELASHLSCAVDSRLQRFNASIGNQAPERLQILLDVVILPAVDHTCVDATPTQGTSDRRDVALQRI
jgi:hypothetical protein